MEEILAKLLELAVSQGIWAVLYIYLFFRMLSESKEREETLNNTITVLCTKIEGGIEDLRKQLKAMANRKDGG
ncbi:MAG: BhlA/UviB family holin-like peptide [Eubacteriales bacterium]|nr:BhlA/UviB family holin-like peptide [Eubacteriales bacterium]